MKYFYFRIEIYSQKLLDLFNIFIETTELSQKKRLTSALDEYL